MAWQFWNYEGEGFSTKAAAEQARDKHLQKDIIIYWNNVWYDEEQNVYGYVLNYKKRVGFWTDLFTT